MKPITHLLVANRGEIARRIFRTCRALGIGTVAVYSEADRNSPHVREADIAVALGGLTAAESYLRVDAILDAAHRSGANAIHPGYGFLSENAAFASAVVDAGLIWVGPTAANITAMGTKVEAKALAVAAGVPTLPSASMVGDNHGEWLAAAAAVGYPLLVKASSGGGGKGMRAVDRPESLVEAIEGARREAASSFGDPTVFVERQLLTPRHIEVQVFGDTHGNVIHLHERECSIQRRHQKIVEEAPSPVLSSDQRARIGETSVALAKAIGYVGAGTVEYLYDDASGEFAFLEMNTRLQVEHPVTECITGLDLVAWQLHVAAGGALPLTQDQVALDGHAIEVRLYAEDPANDFLPSTGTLTLFEPAGSPLVRWDTGCETGSVVSPFYDPMLAKVIAHGETRAQAANLLAHELAGSAVHGVVTNTASLIAILRHDGYLAGDTNTAFLSRFPEVLKPSLAEDAELAHWCAAAAHSSIAARAEDQTWGFAPNGWRNVSSQPQSFLATAQDGRPVEVAYRATGLNTFTMNIGERTVAVAVDGTAVTVDGITRTIAVHHSRSVEASTTVWVNSTHGQLTLTVADRFPLPNALAAAGGPTAPVPGRVVAVQVAVGDAVVADQVLVVVEAMKMEHSIRAAGPGIVSELRVAVGDQVEARQVLVLLTDDV